MKRCRNCGRIRECDKEKLWKKNIKYFENFRCWCPSGCLWIVDEIE